MSEKNADTTGSSATGRGNAPVKPQTMWELALLSAFLPGAGQFANGQRGKGLIFLIPSAILFVDITVRTFILAQMVFAPVMAGEPLFVTDEAFTVLISLFPLLGIALLIWAIALVDTILVGQKLMKRREEEEDASK